MLRSRPPSAASGRGAMAGPGPAPAPSRPGGAEPSARGQSGSKRLVADFWNNSGPCQATGRFHGATDQTLSKPDIAAGRSPFSPPAPMFMSLNPLKTKTQAGQGPPDARRRRRRGTLNADLCMGLAARGAEPAPVLPPRAPRTLHSGSWPGFSALSVQ